GLELGSQFTKHIKKVQFVFNREDKPEVETAQLLKSVLKDGKQRQFYLGLGEDEASPIWLMAEAAQTKIDEKDTPGVIITLTDISKLKQQQLLLGKQLAEISDQNRQWQAIYNGMPESIVLLNTEGRVLTMNPATERITGRKASDGIGLHIGELFPKIDAIVPGLDNKGRSGFMQTLEEGRTSDLFEAIVATKDGRHIWINYTYTPLKDAKGV